MTAFFLWHRAQVHAAWENLRKFNDARAKMGGNPGGTALAKRPGGLLFLETYCAGGNFES